MDINQVLKDASKEIDLANSQEDLQNLKVSYLGKKGKITELLKSLKDLSLEEKKTIGAQINSLRDNVDSLIKEKLFEIKNKTGYGRTWLSSKNQKCAKIFKRGQSS